VSRVFTIILLVAGFAAGCGHASNGASVHPDSSPTLPITVGNYPAYGHAADFSWIAGRLIRSSPAGQCTYVIFSTGSGAPWGGRIALAAQDKVIELFPNGDMVVVTGGLDSKGLGACSDPAMAVKTIREH
jgi:hypothetical protein